MNKIQRYSIDRDPLPWSDDPMRPDDRGLFVLYSDHEAALREVTATEPRYQLTDAGRAALEKK